MKQGSRQFWIGIACVGWIASTPASASVVLKAIQEKTPSEIEVQFDTHVARSQLQLEFFRDIVQLSVKGSVVYPSKMLTLSGEPFAKGFAYQYTPQWVRLRLTTSGAKAESLKSQIQMYVSGKTVRLRYTGSDRLSSSAAKSQAVPPEGNEKGVASKTGNTTTPELGSKQQALLQKILDGEKSASPIAAAQATTGVAKASRATKSSGSSVNPFLGFAWLGVVALGLLVLAFVLRKSSKSAHLKRWFLKNTWIKDPSIVEVLAHHALGPKKNISVVRVKGKTLVLGVTEENISLISQVDADQESWGDVLGEAIQKPQTGAQVAGTPRLAPSPVRNQLREKLKGLKSL